MELVMSSELRVMSWKIDFLSPFPSPQAERDIERSETGRGKDLARSTFQNRIADCTIKTPLL